MTETVTDAALQILVVDDEINILRSLRRLLSEGEYEVLTALSGEEAMDVLRNNPDVALIISDQRMPGLSGVDFLEQAKKIAPDASRIILTGYADVNAAIDGINKGDAYRYITKPWDDSLLLGIVNEAVLKFVLIKDNQRLMRKVKQQNRELQILNSRLEEFVHEQTLEIKKQNDELIKLNEDLKSNFKNMMVAFSSLIELRDVQAGNHSRNVADLSVRIAREMKLSDDEMQAVFNASLLHDIGKIGIPDVLLMKEPADMNEEEKEVYRQHPVRGQTATDTIEDLREEGIIIRHHHEWFNGKGFPDGLKGEKIPLGARIIAIADFIDRAVRRYNGDEAVDLTLRKVKEEMGTRFDSGLYGYLKTPIRDFYEDVLKRADIVEMELQQKDLQIGMVVARDVRSGTGFLILGKGTVLNEKNIESLKRSLRLDPSDKGVFVLVKR